MCIPFHYAMCFLAYRWKQRPPDTKSRYEFLILKEPSRTANKSRSPQVEGCAEEQHVTQLNVKLGNNYPLHKVQAHRGGRAV